ncbi:hypothetical protein [Kocuria rosea]|uniref:hypothetical protein n=1 Tax=Kocuria rosea TaxID=1275 RepID=UPI000D644602|nr:hypothetical protein [Kocuria rosea]PWF79894.1 hypothetical protein DEJ37_17270 [Kocuria rosea]STX15465.1 Uncharacterised protein [Kocuria rosea]
MNELTADGISVAVTCRVLKLSRQPYYRWLAAPITAAELAMALSKIPQGCSLIVPTRWLWSLWRSWGAGSRAA